MDLETLFYAIWLFCFGVLVGMGIPKPGMKSTQAKLEKENEELRRKVVNLSANLWKSVSADPLTNGQAGVHRVSIQHPRTTANDRETQPLTHPSDEE